MAFGAGSSSIGPVIAVGAFLIVLRCSVGFATATARISNCNWNPHRGATGNLLDRPLTGRVEGAVRLHRFWVVPRF